MIEWSPEATTRLFDLYERHVDRLCKDVGKVNLNLDRSNPRKADLEQLTRDQFVAILTDPTHDSEAIQLWVRRIVRGHEPEFPALQAAG